MKTIKLNIPVPEWAKPGLKIPETEYHKLMMVSTNWVNLHAHRKQLTEIDCLRIVCLELSGRKRPELIGRVKAWYDKLRSSRERDDLWEQYPGAGRRG